jgi:hypothetical protein
MNRDVIKLTHVTNETCIIFLKNRLLASVVTFLGPWLFQWPLIEHRVNMVNMVKETHVIQTILDFGIVKQNGKSRQQKVMNLNL